MVRYEILFGFNNVGPHFENGVFKDEPNGIDSFIGDITEKITAKFDVEIKSIEVSAHKMFACQWILYKGLIQSDISCINDGLSSVTCEDIGLGDYNLPICDFCDIKSDINKLYDATRRATMDHQDPRIDKKEFHWGFLGTKLEAILDKVQSKAVAQRVDWQKLALLVRIYQIYLLSVILTEQMLKALDESMADLNILKEYDDSIKSATEGLGEIQQKIDTILQTLIGPDYHEDVDLFSGMTSIAGEQFARNELEDCRFWGLNEEDEYLTLEYTKDTRKAGTVYGRYLAGRKRILFNPLRSEFVDKCLTETTDTEFNRLGNLGVQIGQTVTFPTRRIRSETRHLLWDVFRTWPKCTHKEGREVCRYEKRYKTSVPEPLRFTVRTEVDGMKYGRITPVESL